MTDVDVVTPRAVTPVVIGELTDVPAPGSLVASKWAQEVSSRLIQRFATAAARTAAWAASAIAPPKGMPSYLTTNDAAEGPEYYNGVSWRKPWNQPWGEVAYVEVTAQQLAVANAFTDLTGLAVAFTALPGRKYAIIVSVPVFQATAPGGPSPIVVQLIDGGGVVIDTGSHQCGVSQPAQITFHRRVTPAAGAVTYKLQGKTLAGTMNVASQTYQPSSIMVFDIGPSGAPA
jgi:hypothetical protein